MLTLMKIYKLLAVHGTMKREHGTWTHSFKLDNMKIKTYMEGRDYILHVPGFLSVMWDNDGVYGGFYRKGNSNDVENLWNKLRGEIK